MKFAVIFDLDGVLVDSTSAVHAIATKIAREYGISLSPSEVLESTHFPFPVWVGNWNKRYGKSILVEDVIEKYMGYEREHLKTHSILSPGVLSLLKELHAKKIPIGIATSAPRQRLKNILEVSSIAHFFDALVSIDDVTKGKPDPEPYLKTAAALNISPALCVGIEDTNTGLSSVIAAGMKSIGFAPKSENKAVLSQADLIIQNFSELSAEKLRELISK